MLVGWTDADGPADGRADGRKDFPGGSASLAGANGEQSALHLHSGPPARARRRPELDARISVRQS